MPVTREDLIKAFGEAAIAQMEPVVRLLRLRAAVVDAALKLLHAGGYTALPPELRAATIALDAELNRTPPPAVAAELKPA